MKKVFLIVTLFSFLHFNACCMLGGIYKKDDVSKKIMLQLDHFFDEGGTPDIFADERDVSPLKEKKQTKAKKQEIAKKFFSQKKADDPIFSDSEDSDFASCVSESEPLLNKNKKRLIRRRKIKEFFVKLYNTVALFCSIFKK